MRKIILVIALSITTSYAVVPNVEISNATKGPIWYSIGDLKYHPMQATPLKVERGKYVHKGLTPIAAVQLILIANKQPKPGEPVKIYYLRQETGPFENIYVEAFIDSQGNVRLRPQTGSKTKGNLPIKGNVKQGNIKVKKVTYTAPKAVKAPVEQPAQNIILTLLATQEGKDFVGMMLSNNLENLKRFARQAEPFDKDVQMIANVAAQNFLRTIKKPGITAADLPVIEQYFTKIFYDAIATIKEADQFFINPETRDVTNREIKAFTESQKFKKLPINQEERLIVLQGASQEIAQKIITTLKAPQTYLNQLASELYLTLYNQSLVTRATKEVQEAVSIKPVNLSALDEWIAQKIPETINAIRTLSVREQSAAARESARKLSAEYTQQITGRTPAEIESTFYNAINRELKNIQQQGTSPKATEAKQEGQKMANKSLLDQIREGKTLRHVEEEAKKVPPTAKESLLEQIRRGKPLRYVEEEPKKPAPTVEERTLEEALREKFEKMRPQVEPEEEAEEESEWD